MAIEDQSAFKVWQRLKPDTQFTVRELSSALEEPNESPEEVLEAYLFAKRALAHSMQSLLRSQLPAVSRAAFHEVRARIQDELHSRFSALVPDQYLKVPYGTAANEELFAVLHQEIGSPVDSARLRTINADDIHTERRIRELRELGLDVTSTKVDGNQYYILGSLELDSTRIRELVVKSIRNSKALAKPQKEELIASLQ
ncbi:hypothetical protein GCM10010313_44680 [Streptomyces violarus]|uniref:Uncharacterized protein n=1 Tax=Streptomyces violarus TaxID=67380 RepID=A0A7W4ZRP1_9ACTN|nr:MULTISPECIES: hypothetical protein [Streptomyces]MBB3077393.1 hypothetical protein [Streptomyces violarus]WRU00982.1 hypothetical protein VJ737_26350 [Streptomyces sp. CGMCC 4.1772]GHD16422.1 hypothetical protein GCM10010313_44680 [Streptomyces violarus]